MLITELLKASTVTDMLVIYNRSSKYYGLAMNLFRKRFNIRPQDSFRLDNINDIVRHSERILTKPLYSNFWLFFIEDAKTPLSEETVKLLTGVSSVKLIVGSSNYRIFQDFRYEKRLQGYQVDTMFASMLAKEEFDYIYQATLKTKTAQPLSEKVYDAVVKGYLREPDSVFKLLSSVKEGIKFSTMVELVGHIGLGNLSVEHELLSMMTSTSKTARGLKSFKKRNINRLIELSSRKSYNSIRMSIVSSLKAMLIIKSLIAEGRIIVGVSESFDMKPYKNSSLSKYAHMVERIDAISFKKIVVVLDLVEQSDYWSSDLDILQFVHGFISRTIPVEVIERSKDEAKGNIY